MPKDKVIELYLTTSFVKSGRRAFAVWLHEQYGMCFRVAYEKFRKGKAKRWEWMGIDAVIGEYKNIGSQSIAEFWKNEHKSKFCDYMATQGMSRATVFKRFSANDWEVWERRGIGQLYEEYKKLKGEA